MRTVRQPPVFTLLAVARRHWTLRVYSRNWHSLYTVTISFRPPPAVPIRWSSWARWCRLSSTDKGRSWQRQELPTRPSLIDVSLCPDGEFVALDTMRNIWTSDSGRQPVAKQPLQQPKRSWH